MCLFMAIVRCCCRRGFWGSELMHLANTLPKIRVYAFVCHYRSSFPLCGGLEPLFIWYPDCLKKHEIRISMDGCGRAIDNVFVECLWRSVKYEQVYLHVYDDGNSLWKGLSEYFRFYNREKFHQSSVPPGTCFYEKDAGGQRLKTA